MKKAKTRKSRESQAIRVGILGLGRAGWGMHCRELDGKEHLFKIVAGCDGDEARRKRMAEAYPEAAIYSDVKALCADENVDLITVATFSRDHYKHAKQALAAGKHVFLEKPMATSYAQAKRLVACAEEAKGQLFVRHNRRFDADFVHIREILATGVLGEIQQIKLARVGYARRDDWQTLLAYGGGQVLNWGPHVIDHALQFLGAPKTPLAKIEGHLKRIAAAGDAEDHVKILLTGASGCLADIEISGGAATSLPRYTIWGTKGALTCDGETIVLKYLDPKKKLKPRKAQEGLMETFGTPEKLSWHEESVPVNPKHPQDIWEHLFRAAKGWQPFPVTLEQSLEVMRVASAVKRGTPFTKAKARKK